MAEAIIKPNRNHERTLFAPPPKMCFPRPISASSLLHFLRGARHSQSVRYPSLHPAHKFPSVLIIVLYVLELIRVVLRPKSWLVIRLLAGVSEPSDSVPAVHFCIEIAVTSVKALGYFTVNIKQWWVLFTPSDNVRQHMSLLSHMLRGCHAEAMPALGLRPPDAANVVPWTIEQSTYVLCFVFTARATFYRTLFSRPLSTSRCRQSNV